MQLKVHPYAPAAAPLEGPTKNIAQVAGIKRGFRKHVGVGGGRGGGEQRLANVLQTVAISYRVGRCSTSTSLLIEEILELFHSLHRGIVTSLSL
jgi:hypothetical protein